MDQKLPTPPPENGCEQDYLSLLSPHPLQTNKLTINTSSISQRPISSGHGKSSIQTAPETDNNGDTPLHHLCDSPHVSLAKVAHILDSSSGVSSVVHTNTFGRNPLHKLCGNRSYFISEEHKIEVAKSMLDILTMEERRMVLSEMGSGGDVYMPEKIALVRGDDKLRRFLEGKRVR